MVTLGSGASFKGAGRFTGQGFRIEFERPSPGPYELLRDNGVAIRGASVEAVHKTTEEVKLRIRAYIDAHFTNSAWTRNSHRRVANASAQSVYYDEVEGKGQYAGLVYSKFGKRDSRGFVDFLLLHVRGGTVKPVDGNWLRIVNPRAGGTAGVAAQSGKFALSQSDIFFVRSSDGKKLFQLRRYNKQRRADGSVRTELLVTLLPQVSFPARLTGVDEIARQRPELFEGYFAEALNLRRAQQGA
jgi:hypothetical protein